ncbi:P-loop containing nucleoside triphosphate hydrolase protein [Exidia glandulosa HHB12029]|uniref:p-loop containing nucleoside triphosphate hydrolase protein n=1 Tax=Exidia glandulosa HHB12029 TaxID=1314781 RepID=A0A165Z980_EXIGL|nr:P-loop containing nucleoside triphosphate hydrolase protein [Exidia glandulosa HHB12029]
MTQESQVLSLVSTNGRTAFKIIAVNLGRYDDPPDWQEIIKYHRGSELQNYFTKVLEDNLKALNNPQYADHIPKAPRQPERDNKEENVEALQLREGLTARFSSCLVATRELQRFAIAMSCIRKVNTAKVIRSLLTPDCYVIAVEHDLSVLDYLSDFVCCLYVKPSMYGVVTMPFSVREGINIFLDGFIPTENLRFREDSLSLKMVETAEELIVDKTRRYAYPSTTKTLGGFKLTVQAGEFTDSEIIVMLGENGTGKTTFVRLLAGDTPDVEVDKQSWAFSLKSQTISPKFPGTVRMLLLKQIKAAFMHPQFNTDVMKPMAIEAIIDQDVKTLSGGELQRVAIVLCLGKPNVSLYLIDEPSSFLDSEQRIIASKVIKRFILHAKKTAFIIEHDFIMATYLADRVIVFEGQPAVTATATPPQTLLSGMNKFLSSLEITFRRVPTNYRPRVNKLNSVKDREQNVGVPSGNYFFLED